MSAKYEKSYLHEEEGTYHRREIEPIAPREEKNYTTHHETSYQIAPKSSKTAASKPLSSSSSRAIVDTSDDENNFEEWTTSKRKVNHKTRQVETRVSRQLLVEDGKVIADSGPQVITRIKEDNKVEECEKEKAPKNRGKFDAIACAPESADSSGRVLGEKKEIQRVSREVREENMQYHDERFKELTGHDVHRKALQAPHELITINDRHNQGGGPRGKMVHYSNKGKKYQDTDEILEVAKLAIDGSITKEVKRTRHHEECSEDELPDEKGEAAALRDEPIASRSSRRHVDYVNDFDDTATPSCSSDDEIEGDPQAARRHRKQHKHSSGPKQGRQPRGEEAFPRYEIDPLMNSLRDEDFRPVGADRHSSAGSRHKQVPLVRRDKQDSDSDSDRHEPSGRHSQHQRQHQRQRSPSPPPHRGAPVEIPEEYRVNRQRLMTGGAGGQQRERSFSPPASHRSAARTGSARHHQGHAHTGDQDASVQAHLTDEEVERGSVNSHEKQTRHLQRQSTANSSRNYYYGKPKHQHRQRAPSVSSTSSSAASSIHGDHHLRDKQRKQGTKSRDSGFRSPHSARDRPETPASTHSGGQQQQQIYSVSGKKRLQEGGRPTSPTGSLGQRSVKTTTTTLSAGLQDRPRSRQEPARVKSPPGGAQKAPKLATGQARSVARKRTATKRLTDEDERSLDAISVASLGPNATTIRVPYRNDIRMTDEKDQAGEWRATRETEAQEEEASKRRPGNSGRKQQQFNYRTIIANVQPVPIVPKQQIIDAYNVRVIEHKSPFLDQIQPIKSMSDLSISIARLEQLSSDLSSLPTAKRPLPVPENPGQTQAPSTNQTTELDNNNEANFSLSQFMKQKPGPFQVYGTGLDERANEDENDDNVSLVSSCSLRSSRTYHIRCQDANTLGSQHRLNVDDADLNEANEFPVESIEFLARDAAQQHSGEAENDESDKKGPKAWVFDLRDNSSTAIVAPPKPREPELPKVDAKTEELASSRGGRSYYLELIEKEPRKKANESLYTRWSSQNALSSARKVGQDSACASQQIDSRKSRQMSPSSKPIGPTNQRLHLARSSSVTPGRVEDANPSKPEQAQEQTRRQLPSSGGLWPAHLANRSKSVSCLASSTRPSKYSIYGGFRKPDADKKPVPRLSYSRAIGPKSKRQLENQPKTPSRYLKMK